MVSSERIERRAALRGCARRKRPPRRRLEGRDGSRRHDPRAATESSPTSKRRSPGFWRRKRKRAREPPFHHGVGVSGARLPLERLVPARVRAAAVRDVLRGRQCFFYGSRMVDPGTVGLDGVEPFPWLLVGIAFQIYFSTAPLLVRRKGPRRAGAGDARGDAGFSDPYLRRDLLFRPRGTSRGARSACWSTCSARSSSSGSSSRSGPLALALGVGLTLLSSAGIGMLSASFILYFKRGDPINFLLTMGTTFFGNVIFPSSCFRTPFSGCRTGCR